MIHFLRRLDDLAFSQLREERQKGGFFAYYMAFLMMLIGLTTLFIVFLIVFGLVTMTVNAPVAWLWIGLISGGITGCYLFVLWRSNPNR